MGLSRLRFDHLPSHEEYLSFERGSDERHEFIDGNVFTMAGESLSHSRICVNLAGETGNELKGRLCEPFLMNMKVRSFDSSLFGYPDVTIVCGPKFHDTKKDVLINPKVIFEVLSPLTEVYDRTTKFARFRMGNETLADYILVSQDKPFVEHFTRQPDGDWLYRSFSDLDDSFDIASVECTLSLAEIYDRVEFEPIS